MARFTHRPSDVASSTSSSTCFQKWVVILDVLLVVLLLECWVILLAYQHDDRRCGATGRRGGVVVQAWLLQHPHPQHQHPKSRSDDYYSYFGKDLSVDPRGSGQRRRRTLLALIGSSDSAATTTSDDSDGELLDTAKKDNNGMDNPGPGVAGLYRSLTEAAWERLQSRCGGGGAALQPVNVAPHLAHQQTVPPGRAAAKKSGYNSTTTTTTTAPVVQITIRALQPSNHEQELHVSPIRYARFALIETLVPPNPDNNTDTTTTTSTSGIQVLNMVIFPNQNYTTNINWPVWGADLVSLPGNKHLLLLDAQPMGRNSNNDDDDETIQDWSAHWHDWYQRHNIATQFPWGGDLPEPVQQYVSRYALWSRLTGGAIHNTTITINNNNNNKNNIDTGVDPILQHISQQLPTILLEHLDLYLDLLLLSPPPPSRSTQNPTTIATNNNNTAKSTQNDYIRYRLENDPARPMLKRLFGEEWTEQVLHEVLFPTSLMM